MVCYILPTAAALMVYAHRKKDGRTDEEGKQLNLLLAGGAIFGLVDHAWNGQLLFIGPNPASDLLLGLAITTTIYAFWYGMLLVKQAKANAKSVSVA